jgi:hypothetical protein
VFIFLIKYIYNSSCIKTFWTIEKKIKWSDFVSTLFCLLHCFRSPVFQFCEPRSASFSQPWDQIYVQIAAFSTFDSTMFTVITALCYTFLESSSPITLGTTDPVIHHETYYELSLNTCLLFTVASTHTNRKTVRKALTPEAEQVKPKDTEIGVCWFSAKHAVLRKSKDWLARNQDNVSE